MAAAMRVGDFSSRRFRVVLAALTIAVGAMVLVLTAYWTFYQDEWNFVWGRQGWGIDAFFQPHNEHWTTIPVAGWKVLFAIFGIRTHIPYEAALLVTHGAVVLLLFALVRRRSGYLPAFGAALTLLVLGGGGKDIVWAFQIGFVSSVAFGLLAVLLLERNPPFPGRVLPVSLALLGSLMCSAPGLAFLVAAGVELVFDSKRRRLLVALVVPVLAFAAWFLEFGAGLAGTPGAPCAVGCIRVGFSADVYRGPITVNYLLDVAHFVLVGLEGALAAVTGLTAAGVTGLAFVGPLLMLAFGAVLLVEWYRLDRLQSWQLGLLAGAISWFALIALGRGRSGPNLAAESHYAYVGAVFLLPLLAHTTRAVPWRGLWRPALLAAFTVALISNALQLGALALSEVGTMDTEVAELRTVLAFQGAPEMALDRPLDPTIMPQLTARQFYAATAHLGSPVPASDVQAVRRLPVKAVDAEMVNLFGPALKVTPDTPGSVASLACQTIGFAGGTDIDLGVASGQSVFMLSAAPLKASLYISFLGAPGDTPLLAATLTPNTPDRVHLPDAGKPIPWRLRIAPVGSGSLQVCGDAVLV